MQRTAAVVLLAVGGLACSLAACSSDTTSCASSESLSGGSRASVDVAVRSKAGARYLGLIDVNGGLYEGPVSTSSKGSGALTDLPVGNYDGSVRLTGEKLTLTVQEQTVALTGPLDCD